MNLRTNIFLIVAVLLCACACNSKKQPQAAEASVTHQPEGDFCADSAYQYIAEQVAFGPRVPGTPAHDACAEYLCNKLKAFGADSIIEQKAHVTAFNGTKLPMTNIIARFNSESKRRIMLIAHYDTRPWADSDPNPQNRQTPILGANDGGSGVGVILEIARNIGKRAPEIGIDIFFTDCEDYGVSAQTPNESNDSWCLGTRYWSNNHVPYNSVAEMPEYGILLDMVGGENAVFPIEYHSQNMASTATIRVWSEAERLGFGERFPRNIGGAVEDDHIYVTAAGIPTTDIIECSNNYTGSFPATWHTLDDNLENISRKTLDIVGKTVLTVIYREKKLQ